MFKKLFSKKPEGATDIEQSHAPSGPTTTAPEPSNPPPAPASDAPPAPTPAPTQPPPPQAAAAAESTAPPQPPQQQEAEMAAPTAQPLAPAASLHPQGTLSTTQQQQLDSALSAEFNRTTVLEDTVDADATAAAGTAGTDANLEGSLQPTLSEETGQKSLDHLRAQVEALRAQWIALEQKKTPRNTNNQITGNLAGDADVPSPGAPSMRLPNIPRPPNTDRSAGGHTHRSHLAPQQQQAPSSNSTSIYGSNSPSLPPLSGGRKPLEYGSGNEQRGAPQAASRRKVLSALPRRESYNTNSNSGGEDENKPQWTFYNRDPAKKPQKPKLPELKRPTTAERERLKEWRRMQKERQRKLEEQAKREAEAETQRRREQEEERRRKHREEVLALAERNREERERLAKELADREARFKQEFKQMRQAKPLHERLAAEFEEKVKEEEERKRKALEDAVAKKQKWKPALIFNEQPGARNSASAVRAYEDNSSLPIEALYEMSGAPPPPAQAQAKPKKAAASKKPAPGRPSASSDQPRQYSAEEEAAAVTIQSVFRGYEVRRGLASTQQRPTEGGATEAEAMTPARPYLPSHATITPSAVGAYASPYRFPAEEREVVITYRTLTVCDRATSPLLDDEAVTGTRSHMMLTSTSVNRAAAHHDELQETSGSSFTPAPPGFTGRVPGLGAPHSHHNLSPVAPTRLQLEPVHSAGPLKAAMDTPLEPTSSSIPKLPPLGSMDAPASLEKPKSAKKKKIGSSLQALAAAQSRHKTAVEEEAHDEVVVQEPEPVPQEPEPAPELLEPAGDAPEPEPEPVPQQDPEPEPEPETLFAADTSAAFDEMPPEAEFRGSGSVPVWRDVSQGGAPSSSLIGGGSSPHIEHIDLPEWANELVPDTQAVGDVEMETSAQEGNGTGAADAHAEDEDHPFGGSASGIGFGGATFHVVPLAFPVLKTERAPVKCRSSAAATTSPSVNSQASSGSQIYKGVVFDMDGTLTITNIDFVKMRNDTTITTGDLFTTMEAWADSRKIKKAMDIILDLEAEALRTLQLMDGLRELLDHLKASGIKVALVTRNTTRAVDAFFSILGQEYRPLFSQILTRESPYVKPDFRLMDVISTNWGCTTSDLLMVGDSVEDVEVGNAAGSASCLVEGGGNETSSAAARPPPGSIPSFKVRSLLELRDRIASGNVPTGLGRSADVTSPRDSDAAGGPPPGRDLLDFVYKHGYVRTAASSYPRMGGAAGGLQSSPYPGDNVLHLNCGPVTNLTKLLASQGLQVIGVDADPTFAVKRGLLATRYTGKPLGANSLTGACQDFDRGMKLTPEQERNSPFDVIVYYNLDAESEVTAQLLTAEGLDECWRVLRFGGRMCVEIILHPSWLRPREDASTDLSKLREALEGARFLVKSVDILHRTADWARVRVVAKKPSLSDY